MTTTTTLVVPLAFVEVFPLSTGRVCWTAASLKRQLIQLSVKADLGVSQSLKIKWNTPSDGIRSGQLLLDELQEKNPVLHLRQSSPSVQNPYIACRCDAYIIHQPWMEREEVGVRVTESTLVHIRQKASWMFQLTGEVVAEEVYLPEDDVLSYYNVETIRQLTCYLDIAFSGVTYVGTTEDAFLRKEKSRRRKQVVDQNLCRMLDHPIASNSPRDGFGGQNVILVHSPDHGDGKTTLVTTLLRKLGCSDIHLIRPGPLLAKFGVMADASLATILHEVTTIAAFRHRRIAVVIDQMDMFWGTAADAAAPALSGCVAYLKQLCHSLNQRNEILFPTSSRLYNWRGREGHVVPLKFCLVGITTCADDALSSLEMLSASRFRLPALNAETRQKAFTHAIKKAELTLTQSLQEALPQITAEAVRAKGADFGRVVHDIIYYASRTGATEVTVELFRKSLERVVSNSVATNIVFLSKHESGMFSSVGGNESAKQAIEEALMCDPNQRTVLYSVGLKPPAGILLYGPPGTGKTLLAKAIANFLSKSSGSSSFGGAFISLTSTDIVRSEFGTGEKMLAAAFETAKLNAPSVIFLDEFQALFTQRGSSSSRLTSTLMLCMDNVGKWKSLRNSNELDAHNGTNHVIVLAATNSPWQIDKAFLRPGRFDRCIHVGLPDAVSRQDIYKLQISRMTTQLRMSLDDLCLELSQASDGFSGADIAAHCHAAAVLCLVDGSKCVTEAHFRQAFHDGFRASSDKALVNRLSTWTPS